MVKTVKAGTKMRDFLVKSQKLGEEVVFLHRKPGVKIQNTRCAKRPFGGFEADSISMVADWKSAIQQQLETCATMDGRSLNGIRLNYGGCVLKFGSSPQREAQRYRVLLQISYD